MDSRVTFSCVVWSPEPVKVNLLFKTCDLRKPGDCDGEENFKIKKGEKNFGQECVSNLASHCTPCFPGVSQLTMKWH